MKKAFSYVVITLIVIFFSALVSHAAVVNVNIQNFAFSPQNVTINPGDSVKWTNKDSVLHSSTSGTGCTANGIWDSGLMSNGGFFQEAFTTPGTYPYHCSLHCFTGTVTVNAPSTIPLPTSAEVFTSPVSASPVLNTNASLSVPIGVGSVATGGGTLSLQLDLDQFAGPVDVYFWLYLPVIDTVNVWQFTSTGTLQALSMGLAPLNPNVTGPISESIFGDIPTSALPHGEYDFGVLVTPAGDQSLTEYYFWVTSVSL